MDEKTPDYEGADPQAAANDAVWPEETSIPSQIPVPAEADDDVDIGEPDPNDDHVTFSEVGPPVIDTDGIPPASIAANAAPSEPPAKPRAADWENELSAQRVAVELRRVEADIRAIIDPRDSIRKRRLTGTHRWLELEEDILEWQYTGRFDQATLKRLRELIVQRHHLFDHLRFLASTRPTWNS